jgi:cob(I)alamin adenosyltransferase
MKIYTRSGDKGKTSLLFGERVKKSDLRVEAYGTCDEANSAIGLALSFLVLEDKEAEKDIRGTLYNVQTTLFYVGAELATPVGKEVRWTVNEEHVREIEECIDRWEANLKELKNFILPGGHSAAAALHMARTIVRRAERCAVDIDQVNPIIMAYLNRLSDLLFVAGRYVNSRMGINDVIVKVEK